MVNKQVLRQVYLEKRLLLTDQEYEIRNARVRTNFQQFLANNPVSSLHIFLPIAENREVNTWPIIHDLRQNYPGTLIFTSKVVANGRLEHYHLREDTRLTINRWGIPEPADASPVALRQVDAAVIPLITTDKGGNRIGYGKGYYDRFLDEVEIRHKIGVTLAPPIDQMPYTEAHDVPLTVCIGPWFVLEF